MNQLLSETPVTDSRRLRVTTLVRLRWLAVLGQSLAVLAVAYGLGFAFSTGWCFALIGSSAALNIYLGLKFPAAHRLNHRQSFAVLAFDVLQLSGLLYLTGGMTNPFVFLIIVPVVVSATSLPLIMTFTLGTMVFLATTLLAFFHLPLPWYPAGAFSVPIIYSAGLWVALISSLAFTAIYAWRVADEARLLATALNATELVLQREQHLSALDGLATAAAHELGTPLATIAVVAKEMEKTFEDETGDIALLRSQTERCREILKRLKSLSAAGDEHLARQPFTALIEEVVAPHREFGIEIILEGEKDPETEPINRRNPGVIYGLGNLVENAVDFAKSQVRIGWYWDEKVVRLSVADDGPGFDVFRLEKLGEPFASGRSGLQRETGGGLGLGIFIAKTLLERSGATLRFSNSQIGRGAIVVIEWPRTAFGNFDALEP